MRASLEDQEQTIRHSEQTEDCLDGWASDRKEEFEHLRSGVTEQLEPKGMLAAHGRPELSARGRDSERQEADGGGMAMGMGMGAVARDTGMVSRVKVM